MRKDVFLESKEERFRRFENTAEIRMRWDQEFEQAYRFMMPNRLQLTDSNIRTTSTGLADRGTNRMDEIFDPTGIESVSSFANNLQTSMMPTYQRWAEIEVAENLMQLPPIFRERFGPITEQTVESIKTQVDKATEILFEHFERSRLDQVINEAFMDVAITTGVVLVNEGNLDKPLEFIAIPANQVLIEGGVDQSLQNFWRPLRIRAREIMQKWPQAQLSAQLARKVEKSPDEEVDFIEGTLSYPQNPEGFQFYYFVMTNDGKTEIVTEWRQFDPWIAFRGGKSPGEVYGRGPAMTALPFVRQLNKLSEFMLRGLQMQAYPAFLATSTGDINPWTLVIEPGSIIPVSPDMSGKDAIRPLQTGGDPKVPLEWVQMLQQQIREIMFANPLGPEGLPNKTATEANIINNNWIRKNSGFFARLSVELFPQLINKSLKILTKLGIIPLLDINGVKRPMEIDNLILKLKFTNALALIQDQEDFQKIEQAVMFAQQTFGGLEGLLSLDIGKLPIEAYEKLGLDPELINFDFKDSPVIQAIQNSIQQPVGQPGGAGGQSAPQVPASPLGAQEAANQPLNGGE